MCATAPLAIGALAWVLLLAHPLADGTERIGGNGEVWGDICVAYLATCSTVTGAVVLWGGGGIILRIVQMVVAGTVLLLLAVLIVTGIEWFMVHVWTVEYVVAAAFYTILFSVLWRSLQCSRNSRFHSRKD